jgi:hypothetical protein
VFEVSLVFPCALVDDSHLILRNANPQREKRERREFSQSIAKKIQKQTTADKPASAKPHRESAGVDRMCSTPQADGIGRSLCKLSGDSDLDEINGKITMIIYSNARAPYVRRRFSQTTSLQDRLSEFVEGEARQGGKHAEQR